MSASLSAVGAVTVCVIATAGATAAGCGGGCWKGTVDATAMETGIAEVAGIEEAEAATVEAEEDDAMAAIASGGMLGTRRL